MSERERKRERRPRHKETERGRQRERDKQRQRDPASATTTPLRESKETMLFMFDSESTISSLIGTLCICVVNIYMVYV